eukprot:SAG25_NODE_718_length_5748_cov_8.933794_1_plen_134_part_10
MPPVVAGKWMAWRAGLEKDLAWRAGFEDRNSSPLERLEPLVDERVGGEKGRRVHRWSAAMARPEHLPVEQQPPQQQAATVYHCGRCCSCSSSQRTEQTTTRVTPHGHTVPRQVRARPRKRPSEVLSSAGLDGRL